MANALPLRTDLPHYSMRVQLDGIKYGLEFRWNARESAWYCTLSDDAGDVIEANRKVTLSGIRFRNVDVRRPTGVFVVIDTSGADRAPGLTDLGGRVQVTYLSADEVAAGG